MNNKNNKSLQTFYEELLVVSDKNEITNLLRDLVRIPSYNLENKGEEKVAERLLNFFKNEDIEAEKQYVSPGRPNILAFIGNKKEVGKNILLCGHTDVNPPVGMKIPPFEGIIKNGRLYGRGALDMKGGLVAMAYALALLKRSGLALNGRALFAGVVGEAIGGSEGTKYLVDNLPFKLDMGIVGEPTGFCIVAAHKGMEWFEVIIKGKTAFGAMPEQGINAIEKAVDFINYLRRELYPKLRNRIHPLTGPPTINIGYIEGYGGHRRPNVVPDYCKILIDRRLVPGEDGDQAFNEFVDIINRLAESDPLFKAEARRLPEMIGRLPMEIPSDHKIIKALKESSKIVLNKELPVIGGAGFTDASYFVNYAKIPTVVFGPGEYAGPEAFYEESISIDDVFYASLIFALTIYCIIGGYC